MFTHLSEVCKRALRLSRQGGNRLGALVFLIACLRFRELRHRNGKVGDCVAHELGKPVRPDAAIAVNGQTVSVKLDRMTIDQDVPLDQREMNVRRVWISRQRGGKIGVSHIRQTAPLYPHHHITHLQLESFIRCTFR